MSVWFPPGETRRYAPGPDGAPRIAAIDHADPKAAKTYRDPMLVARADWRDDFAYAADGTPLGWTRHRAGRPPEGFTAAGARILARGADGRPARTAPVAYRLAPRRRGRAPHRGDLPRGGAGAEPGESGMSDPAPPVSVVLPAFNRAASIAGALESVLRQTWRDFELIVVDDASTDGTREAVAAVRDPRLRLLASPANRGAAAARNLGIAAARGDWVAFQDSDDEWLPLKLEKQMARLLAPGAGFVAAYCGMLVIGRAGEDGGRGRRSARRSATCPAATSSRSRARCCRA